MLDFVSTILKRIYNKSDIKLTATYQQKIYITFLFSIIEIMEKMGLKNLPRWTKILGYVSIVIILFLLILLIYTIYSFGGESDVFAFLFFLSYTGAIIGMWILGFFNKWLVSKKIKWLPNFISIAGLFSMLTVSLWPFYEYIRNGPTEGAAPLSWESLKGHIIGWQIPLWIIIAYFVVSLILINKNNDKMA